MREWIDSTCMPARASRCDEPLFWSLSWPITHTCRAAFPHQANLAPSTSTLFPSLGGRLALVSVLRPLWGPSCISRGTFDTPTIHDTRRRIPPTRPLAASPTPKIASEKTHNGFTSNPAFLCRQLAALTAWNTHVRPSRRILSTHNASRSQVSSRGSHSTQYGLPVTVSAQGWPSNRARSSLTLLCQK